MQTIEHPEPNIHNIFNEFDRLYYVLSEKGNKTYGLLKTTTNKVFKPLIKIFNHYGCNCDIIHYSDVKYKPLSYVNNRKEIIISFSGGKDSTATALYYKNKGYKVYLYHLHGINKMYKDEHLAAKKVAELLELPYIEEEIKITGWVYPDWIEHPMKNMIISNRIIQWAVKNNVTPRVAFGNFASSTLNNDPFDVCGGDCKEMWNIYNKIIRNIIPRFKIETPLINMQNTIDTILKNQYVIQDTQSCITPFHYKQRLRLRHKDKYEYNVPQNRCGSCWKCAVEYIVLCDNNVWEYDKVWYKHCLEVLKNTLKREQGLKVRKLEDVWGHYFFYNIEESKYFNEILDFS